MAKRIEKRIVHGVEVEVEVFDYKEPESAQLDRIKVWGPLGSRPAHDSTEGKLADFDEGGRSRAPADRLSHKLSNNGMFTRGRRGRGQ